MTLPWWCCGGAPGRCEVNTRICRESFQPQDEVRSDEVQFEEPAS